MVICCSDNRKLIQARFFFFNLFNLIRTVAPVGENFTPGFLPALGSGSILRTNSGSVSKPGAGISGALAGSGAVHTAECLPI